MFQSFMANVNQFFQNTIQRRIKNQPEQARTKIMVFILIHNYQS